jgi:hypothetical protein
MIPRVDLDALECGKISYVPEIEPPNLSRPLCTLVDVPTDPPTLLLSGEF